MYGSRPHFTVYWLAAVFIAGALQGCASGVTRSTDSAPSKPYFADSSTKAGNVLVSLTPEAQAKLADNLKFDQEKLRSTIRRALEAKNLISPAPEASLPVIEVVVRDVRTRSNFTAVAFGFLAGDDHINGDVVVRDPGGRELQRFGVSAAYALGGLGGGQDDARMGWLYETFAKHTVEELTGTAAP